jgi:hypothetical protein
MGGNDRSTGAEILTMEMQNEEKQPCVFRRIIINITTITTMGRTSRLATVASRIHPLCCASNANHSWTLKKKKGMRAHSSTPKEGNSLQEVAGIGTREYSRDRLVASRRG